MRALELKLPPPVVVLFFAGGMWAVAFITSSVPVSGPVRVAVAAAFAVIGVGFSVAGMMAFRRARTTVNPMKPETASVLVSTGVYRFTRNPMYVGLLFVLVAWAVYLSSVWALFGPALFVVYMTRFQIVPEERALQVLFGNDFARYRAKVRRWL